MVSSPPSGAGLLELEAAALAWRGKRRLASLRFPPQWLLRLATLLADPHLSIKDTLVAVPAGIAVLALRPPQRHRLVAAILGTGWLLCLSDGVIAYEIAARRG